MILKHRLLEKYDEYTFKAPVSGRDKVLVKAGEKVVEGTEMFFRKGNYVRHSFYLPDQLSCNISNLPDCVTCIDGELINEGDVLAEKIAAGGLTVKRLVSPSSGIVDLARIRHGYIDILGEEQESLFKSTFDAEIIDVNPLDGITFKTSALALDLISISNTQNITLAGEFKTINTGKDVKLKGDDASYQDKIVFVGKHLHQGLLKDLFEKGAKFVLTYSMDYQDYRNQGLPIGIVGGFGEIYSGEKLLKTLADLEGCYTVVDFQESQIFFLKDTKKGGEKESVFVKNLIGSKMISHASGSYGMNGEIVGVEGNGYATIEWENGGRGIVSLGSMEFISY